MNPLKKPVQVLIADNQFLITESLKSILQNDGLFQVNKVITNKFDLITTLNKEEISILIIDYLQIGLTSFSELKEIKSSFPDLRFLVISNSISKSDIHELNNIGINNIILKTAHEEEIFAALDASLKSRKYYSNELMDLLLEPGVRRKSANGSNRLTFSEAEIVKLIADGLTTKEIALHKHISFHTVITHRKNIFRKLNVSSISELIMHAIKAGWIDNIEYYI